MDGLDREAGAGRERQEERRQSGSRGEAANVVGSGGAILGESVEEVATRRWAQEITIKLTNGDTIAVVQEFKKEGRINVGERVQVLKGGGGATVRRML